jgi:hypothetical protein
MLYSYDGYRVVQLGEQAGVTREELGEPKILEMLLED